MLLRVGGSRSLCTSENLNKSAALARRLCDTMQKDMLSGSFSTRFHSMANTPGKNWNDPLHLYCAAGFTDAYLVSLTHLHRCICTCCTCTIWQIYHFLEIPGWQSSSYAACIYSFLTGKSPAEYCSLRTQYSYKTQLLHECSFFLPSACFVFELVSLLLTFHQFVGLFRTLKEKHKRLK